MIHWEAYDAPRHMDIIGEPELRLADQRELEASTGLPWLTALVQSLGLSKVHSEIIFGDGQPIAYCGLVEMAERIAAPWAVAAPEVFNHWKPVERRWHELVKRYLGQYDQLVNVIDCRNEKHILWCEKLGFKFGPIFSLKGFAFRTIYMGKDDLCVIP